MWHLRKDEKKLEKGENEKFKYFSEAIFPTQSRERIICRAQMVEGAADDGVKQAINSPSIQMWNEILHRRGFAGKNISTFYGNNNAR